MNLTMTLEKTVGYRRKGVFQFDFHFKPEPVFRLARINIVDLVTGNSVNGWDEKKGGDIDPAKYAQVLEEMDLRFLFFQFIDGIKIEICGVATHQYSMERMAMMSLLEETEEVPSPAVEPSDPPKPAFQSGDLCFSEV